MLMKKQHSHQIQYFTYSDSNELPETIQQQFAILQQKVSTAYAPYSQFNVAAAVLLSNGKWIYGTNQENAAYPSGLCAERVALFYAKSQYPDVEVKTILILTEKAFSPPCPPCGACRQVISEYETNQAGAIELYLFSQQEIWHFPSATDLLPFHFSADNLK